jgi:hypothetical protein
MEYAFRVFAAIYGYRVVNTICDSNVRQILYGGKPEDTGPEVCRIPSLCRPRPINACVPSPAKVRYAGEDIFLFYGVDLESNRPDWLGEIFEWLSSGHEQGIFRRDAVGRIADRDMVFGRCGIPHWKPQASLIMAWLENALHNGDEQQALPKAPSPDPGADHLVICSHDVDFYFTTRANALHRLVKNLGIAVLQYKSWDYFSANSRMLAKLLGDARVGDYIPALLSRMEQNDSRSTLFVVPQGAHCRDPNYALRELAPVLKDAARRGFSVEIHASYTSILENRALHSEAAEFSAALGNPASGSRQHWLRFGDPQLLFEQIAEAQLQFDSSLGFTDNVGFRSGASFAFPPYDFKSERPYNFLEIPLAIMDGSLLEESRATGRSAQSLADRVLEESRKRGWGGISILWHNPVEALAVPKQVNRVFWNCNSQKYQAREKWISTREFLSISHSRYRDAGLLTAVPAPNETVRAASGT